MQKFCMSQPSTGRRSGVTLTEVLMSMMVMAVGVVMVMSLFPVGALRTLQATKLTNAAILSRNVDALLAQNPRLIFDPNGDGNIVQHIQPAIVRNYIVDPLSFHIYAELQQAGTPMGQTLQDFTQFGNDGGRRLAPLNGFSIPRYGGGLRTKAGADWTTSLVDAKTLRLLATTFASQPDGWSTDIETFATGVELDENNNVIGVKLENLTADHLQNAGSSSSLNINTSFVGRIDDPEIYRIVVFDLDEQISQTFPLTYLDLELADDTEIGAGNNQDNDIEASWTEGGVTSPLDFNGNGRIDNRILPVEFNQQVGRVLLQSRRTNEFSWMLTVRRRADGNARSVDVVVRFRSGVDFKDEELFPANCLGGTNIIGVKNNSASTPRLKRGGFAFDIVNAVWYRITGVQEKPAFGGAGDFSWDDYDYRVTVEKAIRVLESTGSDAFDDGLLNGSDVSAFGRAMFPVGIVEVYPLGSKEIPDSLR